LGVAAPSTDHDDLARIDDDMMLFSPSSYAARRLQEDRGRGGARENWEVVAVEATRRDFDAPQNAETMETGL